MIHTNERSSITRSKNTNTNKVHVGHGVTNVPEESIGAVPPLSLKV
ncbi:MAG: hypothetical protein CM15mV26_0310 [uncultured marine virus]|nr:MAG: hypothetical protein CM15mV26_0310 [uncultured marine virus]